MPASYKSNSIHNLPFSKLYNWKIFEYRLRKVKYLIMASKLKYIWRKKIFWKFQIFSEFLTSNSNLKLKHYNTIPPSFCQTQFWDKWPGVSLYNLSVEGVNLTIFYWHNINFNNRQVHHFPLWLLPGPPGPLAHLCWAMNLTTFHQEM